MRVTPTSHLLALLFAASACARPAAQQQPYDLLIAGGSVLDGEGTPAVRADVGIRGGRIAAIGDLQTAPAARRIDASGLTVAPGFIDIHNHSDYTILAEPKAESMIRQGVTTIVLGESRSAGPIKAGAEEARARADGVTVDWTTLGGYFQKLERQRMSTNIASYVGEEQVWTYVKGYGQSPATAGELAAMKRLIAQAMEEGAMGLSTSLLQPPSSLATTANLIELAAVAKQYGGIYSSHIRDEGEGVFRAIDEAIQVGRGAKIPVDIIHMKIAHQRLWGRANEIVAMVRKARDEGHDIRANVYPYTAGQNNLSSIVPPWAHDGGREKLLERLGDPAARKRMREEVMNGLPDWYNHYLATGDGWGGMILVSLRHERNRPFQGKRMSELIAARGGHPADVLFDVLLEENGSVPAVFFHHSESDMQLIMQQPWTSIGSDGSAVNPDGPTGRSHPHPRYYGTFPRVLGRYVRELKTITLPEAVKKMTSMNADKIGIKDRGRLKEGAFADVTIFDRDRVIDRATFENPHQFPVGIEYVIVNGQVTIDRGRHTGALAGQVIYGPGKRRAQPGRGDVPPAGSPGSVRAVAPSPTTRLFFLDIRRGRVVSAAPDGSDLKVLVSGRTGIPDGLAVDTERGHVYWTVMGRPRDDDGRIERVDLDGGNLTTIVAAGGAFTPKQLRLDAAHRKLYWSDREGMRVMRANLDGSNIETLVETARGEAARADARNWCVGLALDVDGGKVYWTQKGGDNAGVGSIRRAGLEIPAGEDAAHRSDIEVLFDGLPEPIDLDLDLGQRMIYWTDRGGGPRGNSVNRAPMHPPGGVNPGSRRDQQILMRNLEEAIGIALDLPGGRLYATDLGGRVYSARLDGTDQKVVLTGQGSLTGIAVVDVTAPRER